MIKLIKHAVNIVKHKLRDVGLPARSGKWRTVEKNFLLEHPVCAACGGSKKLNVHHIKPFHMFRELELDPNNLITLCMSFEREDHVLLGHCGNFKLYNPNIREDAAKVLKHPEEFDKIVLAAKNNAKVN
jgi:5-methylcytosine-specific restriction enzyme A